MGVSTGIRTFVKGNKNLYAIARYIVTKSRTMSKQILKVPDRRDIVQKALDKTDGKIYLEIGAANGETLGSIKAKTRIGIDFLPPFENVSKILGQDTEYFQMTSDDFFKNEADKRFSKDKIDVAFIDGLHEYKQVLKDVKNCLKYLNEGGIIVMHDCNPWAEAVALPGESVEEAAEEAKRRDLDWTGSWTGDVWKCIVHFRSLEKEYNVFVLDCDCGIGIIIKGEPEDTLGYSLEDIKRMNYQDLVNDRKRLLNLKDSNYFSDNSK